MPYNLPVVIFYRTDIRSILPKMLYSDRKKEYSVPYAVDKRKIFIIG